MIAAQMGEYIKESIHNYASDVLQTLGHEVQINDIWNDLAEIRPGYLKASFYVKGLDNVNRKDFNVLAAALKQKCPEVKEFKVKFKRPDKEVRFFLEVSKQDNKFEHVQ